MSAPAQKRFRRLFVAAILLSFSIAQLWPLWLGNGWYISHDTVRYPLLLEAFRDVFMQGILYPRWLPDVNGAYGYPTFVFYFPGFFFIGLIPALLFASPAHAVIATVILLFFIGATGAYRLARHYSHPPMRAVLFAGIYLLTPYGLIDLFQRGALAELSVMELSPWALWLALRMLRGHHAGRYMAALAMVLALMMLVHSLVALMMIGLLLWLAVTVWWRHSAPMILAMLLALTASALYWWPAEMMRPLVHFERNLTGIFTASNDLFPNFFVLFEIFQPHYLLALAGFWMARRERLFRMLFVAWIIGIFMMSQLSKPLWETLTPLAIIQFPFRIYSITTPIQYLAMLQLYRLSGWFPARRLTIFIFYAFLMTIALCSDYYRTVLQVNYTDAVYNRFQQVPFVTHTSATSREFDPQTMSLAGLTDRHMHPFPAVELPDCKNAALTSDIPLDHTPARLRFTVDGRCTVRINQMGFPGWKIEVNGHDTGYTLDKNGRMLLALPPGHNAVTAWYDGPPDTDHHRAIILSLLAVLVMLSGYVLRREPLTHS